MSSYDPKRAYYERNRQAVIDRAAAWKRANPERLGAIRAREAENRALREVDEGRRTELLAANRAYKAANRARCSERERLRKAVIRSVDAERVDPLVVLEMDDGICGICGEDVDPTHFHVDHILPLSRGGEHSYANAQPAHPICNQRKHDKLPEALP